MTKKPVQKDTSIEAKFKLMENRIKRLENKVKELERRQIMDIEEITQINDKMNAPSP